MMNAEVQYLSRYFGCPVTVEAGHTCGKPVSHEESEDGQYWVSRCDDHCNQTDNWLCDRCNHRTTVHDHSDSGVISCRQIGCDVDHRAGRYIEATV